MYARGIVGEGERKSVEPIAARATGDAAACERVQARLLNFLRESPWDDHLVRREAARHVVRALEAQEPITTWIIDDTGFPKQGKHSVGVQRQYSGTLGKVGNCQIGVSLTIATKHEHVPIDFALYMPEAWTEDATRRKKARVPDDLVFKSKPDLAVDLITRALEDEIPGSIVLADAAFGNSSDFRNTVRIFGLDLGVAVQGSTKVWSLDARDRRRGEPLPCQELGIDLGRRAFRKLTWRVGTGGKLSSRFAFRRVKVAHDDGTDAGDREPLLLKMEWPELDAKPTDLHPHDSSAPDVEKGDRAHRERALAHRARLRGAQGRTRSGPLRRPLVLGLAPPHLGCSLLLRVPRFGACAAFSPLGQTATSKSSGHDRGLSGTLPILSSPYASSSHARSQDGCRDAPPVYAIAMSIDHDALRTAPA